MIRDRNGEKVRVGDILMFPYVDPIGKIHEDELSFEAKVIFKHGCMGYETQTEFIPLFKWSKTKRGKYIPNKGYRIEILDIYPFKIKNQGGHNENTCLDESTT